MDITIIFHFSFLIPFVEGSSTGFFLELVSCTILSVLARSSLALTFFHFVSMDFTGIHSFVPSLLLCDLGEQAQDYQLGDFDDEMLVDISIGEQIERILHLLPRRIDVSGREKLDPNIRRHDLNNRACALAPDGDDFVFGWRHACWAEGVVGKDGAADGLQGGRQERWIE